MNDLPTDSAPQETGDHPPDKKEEQKANKQLVTPNLNNPPHSSSLWNHFDTPSKLLAGLAFALWMVEDYTQIKFFLFIAAVCGIADVFYLILHKFLSRNPTLIKVGWVVYAGLIIWMFSSNRSIKPEPKPHPKFTVLLQTEEYPDALVPLTNDFLWKKDFARKFNADGFVFLPVHKFEPDIAIDLYIKNDSSVLAEDLEMNVSIPKDVAFNPGNDWRRTTTENNSEWIGGGLPDVPMQSWGFWFTPQILSGNGVVTPKLRFPSPPTNMQIFFNVLIRAKDCPAQEICCSLFVYPIESNCPSHKPFVIESKPWPLHTNILFVTPDEVIENMNK